MAIESEKVIPHSTEEIVTAYASREFHEHLAAKVGSELRSFDASEHEGGWRIVSEQALSADKLPEIARKVLKGTVNVTITDTWGAPDSSGSRRSDTEVKVSGAPVKGVASQTLHARGTAETLATVRGDVDVKVPLIGGKIKAAAEPYIARFIELQAKEVTRFLAKNS